MLQNAGKQKNYMNMETKEKKSSLSKISSLGLSIITFFLASIILFLFFYLVGDVIAHISYDIVIVIACFFICKINPKSVWYVLIVCNAFGIIAAIVEPSFWITDMWLFFCGGWVLSLIGAIIGAMVGKRSNLIVKPK